MESFGAEPVEVAKSLESDIECAITMHNYSIALHLLGNWKCATESSGNKGTTLIENSRRLLKLSHCVLSTCQSPEWQGFLEGTILLKESDAPFLPSLLFDYDMEAKNQFLHLPRFLLASVLTLHALIYFTSHDSATDSSMIANNVGVYQGALERLQAVIRMVQCQLLWCKPKIPGSGLASAA